MFQALQVTDLVEQFFLLAGAPPLPARSEPCHGLSRAAAPPTSGLDGIIPQLNAELFRLLLVRPMSPDRALKFIIIRDVILYSAFTAYFSIPRQITIVVVGVVLMLTILLFEKPLKGMAAKLDLRQKKIQFGVGCFFMLLWLGLLLAWIFRHSSPPAWAVGSLGIIVLLTLLYASYDMTFRRTPKA
jgi:hypothetical protein